MNKVKDKVKKVPVVVQLDAVECGAAALSMILAYYGKWLSLEQLRTDCGISRDGSNGRSIILAARRHDLDAHGYQADIAHLPSLAPAIIHWNHNHFVVFKGFAGGMAYVNDPAVGSIAVTMKEFEPRTCEICGEGLYRRSHTCTSHTTVQTARSSDKHFPLYTREYQRCWRRVYVHPYHGSASGICRHALSAFLTSLSR